MPSYSLGHLKNHVLLRDLAALVTQDRATTATLLAHIAEVDARRLYADAAYSSMFDYCVRELGFSEDMAAKRIRAARTARRFPAIFTGIADGRLHVTGVCLITLPLKHLRGAAAAELITAVECKTKEEIQLMLAERFPQADVATRVRAVAEPTRCVLSSQVLEPVEVQRPSSELLDCASERREDSSAPEAATPMSSAVTIPTEPAPSGRTAPLSPGRFSLQLTMSAETRGKMRRAEQLLGHAVPRGDLAQVLDRALDALIEKLERRRFGTTDSPRAARPSRSVRHVPAGVRRAVKARDGGQCTFESDSGRRCEERGDLEFDHIQPIAKGGETTVANLRLRCRAHNQLEAERAFGAGFMETKRARARLDGPSPGTTSPRA
jgi:5-methylcytosine-specific restriction endonuclease McrA